MFVARGVGALPRGLGVSVRCMSQATKVYGGLKDSDRIFQNLYGLHDWGIKGAMQRVSYAMPWPSSECYSRITGCMVQDQGDGPQGPRLDHQGDQGLVSARSWWRRLGFFALKHKYDALIIRPGFPSGLKWSFMQKPDDGRFDTSLVAITLRLTL